MAYTGIILAGGQSRRMGRDKSLMSLGGRTLIQRVLDALSPLCTELLLVTNAPDKYAHLSLKMIPDAFPNAGSLGGLYSGLEAASNDVALAVACDMPFLNAALLRHLIELAADVDAVVPDLSDSSTSPPASRLTRDDRPLLQSRVASAPSADAAHATGVRDTGQREGRKAKQLDLHPLHAAYRRTCLAPIAAQLRAGDLRMIGFFAHVNVRYVMRDELVRFDPQLRSFFNVNTPEQWADAEKMVG